jgi:UV DNA damage endonuclease
MLSTAKDNLGVTLDIPGWNEDRSIDVFRISSAVIAFAPLLDDIEGYAREHRMRLSMYPGQYTILNALDARVPTAALEELDYHNSLLS